tara:strand:- start:12724 stop:13179 length:456 start_codon:yes stop_codon:yes gene_type:complete
MSFLKNHIILISFFIILIGCQLQEPNKNHGILFIENRAENLVVKKSNKNDVLKILGNPHSKSIDNEDRWIYLERVLTKGEFHKLGQNVLKKNNVLVLDFDKFGVLKNKKLLNINDKEKLVFSKKSTENNLTKKSFVENLLQSVKSKMYRDK